MKVKLCQCAGDNDLTVINWWEPISNSIVRIVRIAWQSKSESDSGIFHGIFNDYYYFVET